MLLFCIRSLLTVFEGRQLEIYVMDDDKNPMDGGYVENMLSMSPAVHYEQTSFERNKNLNGKACIEGMVEKFIEHAAGREALNIKIDPDTIVCHTTVFDAFYANRDASQAATTRPGCHFSGILYMFRTEPLQRALELIREFPIPVERGPEDYIIGLAVCSAALPKKALMISVWNETSKVGVACAWNYGIPKERYDALIPLYYKQFQFITMGNWFLHEGLTLEDRLLPARMLMKEIEKGKR